MKTESPRILDKSFKRCSLSWRPAVALEIIHIITGRSRAFQQFLSFSASYLPMVRPGLASAPAYSGVEGIR
jgi:hypothetical protein